MSVLQCLLLFSLFVGVLSESYTRSGINPLNTNKLDEYLKANLTVIAMWSNKECTTCDLEIFTMYKMIYLYQEYEKVIIAATNTGTDSELEEKYRIESKTKTPQYRLFVKGHDTPYLNNMNKPTLEWIKDVMGFVPRKESVMALNNHNYAFLKTKYSTSNILYLFCKPSEPKCQKIIAGYLVAADVFRTTKNALFVYVDCSLHPDLCKAHSINKVPSFRIKYATKEFAEDVTLASVHGENIVGFMNDVCGTRLLSNGHYDENYGRVTELDVLAHQFMVAEDEETRKEIIVKVNELTKKYPEASRYLNYMRRIFKEGSVVIIQELSLIKQRLQNSKPGSKESKIYSAKNNVIHQFESLTTWKTLVTLHPWNFNYLLTKNHMIVLLTVEECEECKKASTVFNNLAKKGARGVIVASMNAEKYADFLYRFHITSYPSVFFYRKGDSLLEPIKYRGDIELYALHDFVDDQLDEFYASDL